MEKQNMTFTVKDSDITITTRVWFLNIFIIVYIILDVE
jgi:hypothetical protein